MNATRFERLIFAVNKRLKDIDLLRLLSESYSLDKPRDTTRTEEAGPHSIAGAAGRVDVEPETETRNPKPSIYQASMRRNASPGGSRMSCNTSRLPRPARSFELRVLWTPLMIFTRAMDKIDP